MWTELAAAAATLWWLILALPWHPWGTAERLDAPLDARQEDLSDVTVLIPARNEAGTVSRVLDSLAAQGPGLRVILVDDESSDGTAAAARRSRIENLTVLTSIPLPPGWTGKLWALEQGRSMVASPLTLLLDADIALAPGTVAALRHRLRDQGLQLVSLMAAPDLTRFWERALMPAFIYFFKLLYPFRLANARHRLVAAAAGGCVLLETERLARIGGFGAIRDALIDDCALARRVKIDGGRTWIGLTRSARMLRHHGFRDIWDMVARTAFTQLRYSVLLLLLCSGLLLLAFAVPVAGFGAHGPWPPMLCAGAWAGMLISYRPTLRFYGLPTAWGLALPLVGTLYLAMTWWSAIRYWRGHRSQWKDRTYARISKDGVSR
ncbi:MAG: glycosyl transferase [Chromatiales bacterium 21-64-14]|nr:MAG: glycosyl transferase [Chromatiales bacterium 21-64-14]